MVKEKVFAAKSVVKLCSRPEDRARVGPLPPVFESHEEEYCVEKFSIEKFGAVSRRSSLLTTIHHLQKVVGDGCVHGRVRDESGGVGLVVSWLASLR